MLQVITYFLLCAFFGGIFIWYHKIRGRTNKVLIEIGVGLGIFFICGVLVILSAIEKNVILSAKTAHFENFENSNVRRIWVEKVPYEGKIQLTFLSIMGDTTYSLILTKEEVEKLKGELP